MLSLVCFILEEGSLSHVVNPAVLNGYKLAHNDNVKRYHCE